MTAPRDQAPAGFSADWLALREPFDAAARDAAAGPLRLAQRLARWRPPAGSPWRVIDLACGTGANLRWLSPRLGGAQQWLVVDHDPGLLSAWPAIAPPVEIQPRRLDLNRDLEALPWQAAQLVTASALLDLVSLRWLERLVALLRGSPAALLFSLSVDGRHDWQPVDPLDARVGECFAAHQRRDKGFGPALGAAAVPALQALLEAAGYRVELAASDWQLGSEGDGPRLQRALVEGMAGAAREQQPDAGPALRAWARRRLALAGSSRLCVGHIDLLAWPAAAEAA